MKWIISGVLVVIFVIFCFGFINYYWVFGEGVKGGRLLDCRYKGYIFKTYEGQLDLGKLVQATDKTFDFSVSDKRIADSLMKCAGREISLHYIEYKNPIMWRGMQRYIVDSIISVK